MRDLFKNLLNYILRSWDKEERYTHPQLKTLPPFFYELIVYLVAIAILYKLVLYLFSSI